ncbi:MAG: hypothetical protein OEY14_12795 [Myxococcales bacterium]|nr:hypothetical protein [Myxococcales bacterium]
MPRSPEPSALYLRQILLAEIGVEGQARLLTSGFRPAPQAPGGASMAEYLRRAGLREAQTGPSPRLLETEALAAVAGHPALEPAAAALGGAFAAVEAIKAALGIGRPGAPPAQLRLFPASDPEPRGDEASEKEVGG